MKNSSAHGSNFIHRWLSRTSNPTTTDDHDPSEVATQPTNPFPPLSPPPLTDSSSTTASSSVILTPRPTFRQPISTTKSSLVSGIQPRTPPTRYTKLPVVNTNRAVSLPINNHAPRPELTVSRTEIKLHRLLCHDPMCRALKFDISLPINFILQYPPSSLPSTMVVRRQLFPPRPITSLQPMTNHDLSQLATTPPVTRMVIMSDLIPWSIIVRGRTTLPDDPKSFIRVVDVLEGIYKSLREGVSNDEWNRVPKSFRDQVKRAYSRRCRASLPFTLQGYEEKQGVRRVDYLKDKTMFLGLTMKVLDEGNVGSSRNGEDITWSVKLAPGPG